jgi:uncharacterized protein (UPF0548 family)
MNVGGIRWPKLSRAELDDELERARSHSLTYARVGATLDDTLDLPTWRRQLGDDPEAFGRGVQALKTWAPQRRLGAAVHPDGVRLAAGATLLVVLPFGPLEVVAPVRVVRLIEEDNRFGFAYGTLPGHPEQGEESFLVERSEDGSVIATISVDSRPGTFLTWLGAPIAGALQRRAIARYLEALT